MATMLYGIEREIDSGKATDEAVAGRGKRLSLNMADAIATTTRNEALAATLGSDITELHCRRRKAETTAFENHVSAREFEWYL